MMIIIINSLNNYIGYLKTFVSAMQSEWARTHAIDSVAQEYKFPFYFYACSVCGVCLYSVSFAITPLTIFYT